MDKLEHIRGAVAHHVYEEEGNWFVDLAHSSKVDQARITVRYQEEFERYIGTKQSQQSGRDSYIPESPDVAAHDVTSERDTLR